MDLGEEIDQAVCREVQEETGVHAEFVSMLSMRVQHGAAFGRDDLYIACLLKPTSRDIVADTAEIAECAWLPLKEYFEITQASASRRGVGDTFNSHLMRNLVAQISQGKALEDIGWIQTSLLSGSARSDEQITGRTNQQKYCVLAPAAFKALQPEGMLICCKLDHYITNNHDMAITRCC